MAGPTESSTDVNRLLRKGMSLLESGDADGAHSDFSRAIKIDPNRAVAYRLRGSAHLRKRSCDKAIADFDLAIKLAPDDAVAHYLRGRAHHSNKHFAQAYSSYDEAIKLKPDYLKAFQARDAALRELTKQNSEQEESASLVSQPSDLDSSTATASLSENAPTFHKWSFFLWDEVHHGPAIGARVKLFALWVIVGLILDLVLTHFSYPTLGFFALGGAMLNGLWPTLNYGIWTGSCPGCDKGIHVSGKANAHKAFNCPVCTRRVLLQFGKFQVV